MSSSSNPLPQRHNVNLPLLVPSIIITDESENDADVTVNVLEEVEIIPRRRKNEVAEGLANYFPRYTLKRSGVVLPDERPPVGQSLILGLQHVLAMFGSTVLAPLLMGFDTNTCLFFSGVGTLIFYIVTAGRVPSYVGSSFGFISVVISTTGYNYSPGVQNLNLPVATGGILVCGAVYGAIGLIVMVLGHQWIEVLMPPVVTGAVVVTIGLNLSSSAISQASSSGFAGYMAFSTIMAVALFNVYAPGPIRRLPILFGALIGYAINLVCGLTGVGPRIDYSSVTAAAWVAPPRFQLPVFRGAAISTIVPVCIVLIAENIGHVKAVGAMTKRNLDMYLGRAFLGDAIATVVSAAGGGTGTTTYAENIGVMAVTKIFSTLIFVIAALVAILLGFIPKFGAAVHTFPPGVLGGLSIVLFGLIAITGVRIWVEARVDFSNTRNLLTAGVSVLLGAGMTNTTIAWGPVQFDGIGVATISAIVLYQLLRGWGGGGDKEVWEMVERHGSVNSSTECE